MSEKQLNRGDVVLDTRRQFVGIVEQVSAEMVAIHAFIEADISVRLEDAVKVGDCAPESFHSEVHVALATGRLGVLSRLQAHLENSKAPLDDAYLLFAAVKYLIEDSLRLRELLKEARLSRGESVTLVDSDQELENECRSQPS